MLQQNSIMTTLIPLTDLNSRTDLPAELILGFYIDSDSEKENRDLLSNRKSEALISLFLADSKNDFHSYQYKKMSGGKPYLQFEDRTIGLSISHTFQYFLIGINKNGEIGIDVEMTDRKTHPKLGERIKNLRDQFLYDIPTLQIWTIKEAVLKLTGSGLRTNMNNIELHQKSETLFDVFHENYNISIVSFEQSGCWISVAWTINN